MPDLLFESPPGDAPGPISRLGLQPLLDVLRHLQEIGEGLVQHVDGDWDNASSALPIAELQNTEVTELELKFSSNARPEVVCVDPGICDLSWSGVPVTNLHNEIVRQLFVLHQDRGTLDPLFMELQLMLFHLRLDGCTTTREARSAPVASLQNSNTSLEGLLCIVFQVEDAPEDRRAQSFLFVLGIGRWSSFLQAPRCILANLVCVEQELLPMLDLRIAQRSIGCDDGKPTIVVVLHGRVPRHSGIQVPDVIVVL
mmetsp:Transcript_27611/g.58391  ORF Transcript_27611/g.58391 Transcript_27611/m.58391 type:complete len:255 (+) Transcript_27611:196-960(+)